MTACKTCPECATVTSDQCNCLHMKCSISVCILYIYSTQRCPFIILMTHQTECKLRGRDKTAVHHIWLLHTWEFQSSGIWCYVNGWVLPDILKTHNAFIPRVRVQAEQPMVEMWHYISVVSNTSGHQKPLKKTTKYHIPNDLNLQKCTFLKQPSFIDLKLKIWNTIIQNP